MTFWKISHFAFQTDAFCIFLMSILKSSIQVILRMNWGRRKEGKKTHRARASLFYYSFGETDIINSVDFLCLCPGGSELFDWSLAVKSFKNLPFVFCLQILFLTVQYCNKSHDSTDIYHTIHCCFPCLYIPGTSDFPFPLTILVWMWTKAKYVWHKTEWLSHFNHALNQGSWFAFRHHLV